MIDAYLESLKLSLVGLVWGASLNSMPRGKRGAVRCMRLVHMLFREIVEGGIPIRSASLVFTTLLSLVPLLAVSFSVLKAFGVHNKLEQVLYSSVEPLGQAGFELVEQILGFVDNVEVGKLGSVGLVLLFVTVISLVHKVETALNHAWRIEKTRSLGQRFSGYLSVLLVGPLLVFSAIGVIGAIMGTEIVQSISAIEPFGTVIALISKLVPFMLVMAAFSFVYGYIPNTRVQLRAALIGGSVSGVLWVSAGWMFAALVVNSPSSNYAAIYSSFSIVFFFMLWLYVTWLILLIGGSVAFYQQHPEYLGVMPGELQASNRLRERMALAVMLRVGRAHLVGAPPLDTLTLSRDMGLPRGLIQETIGALEVAGFLIATDAPSGYMPARDVAGIQLVDILTTVRCAHEHKDLVPDKLPADPLAEGVMEELELGALAVLGSRSLKDLIEFRSPGGDVESSVTLVR